MVGIGASAGGLEALELFFGNVPADTPLAFAVVQHLDPTHHAMLVELLQRVSAIPIAQAVDGARIEGGHVYVIPPNRDLAVRGGQLVVKVPKAPRGLRLPVDALFRSLAEGQGDLSIGVVLSGMGTDGTEGLRAIRARGGATFVQSIDSAKFDGMPRSAIDARLADCVAAPQAMPAEIALRAAVRQAPKDGAKPAERTIEDALPDIFAVLRTATGHDFAGYKPSTLCRRIERRMDARQMRDASAYVAYLRETPTEAPLLLREMLIGVTAFFRDPRAWAELARRDLPELLARCPAGGALRAWVPACSTGEEAYSLAMALREAMDACVPPKNVRLQVFATDIDEAAIERARRGWFPATAARGIGARRLDAFFVPEAGGFRIRKAVRDDVVFATQNLVQDPPFTRLDLVACRNLLIYLSPPQQAKALAVFHYALEPEGILFLGSAESADGVRDGFALRGKERIYLRLDTPGTSRVAIPAATRHASLADAPALPLASSVDAAFQQAVERLFLDRFAPSAVLTDAKGDVIYLSGQAARYLELPTGKADWNVFAMSRRGLRAHLVGAFHKAATTAARVTLEDVATGRGTGSVDVGVEQLTAPAALRGKMLVVFREAAPAAAQRRPATRSKSRPALSRAQLERELEAVQTEAQVHRQDTQLAEEDLRSVNEELQSTNEELMTSKEEMQSMNEELQTLNHELQAKVDDLASASSDMRNLLDSTEIAILFLDGALAVRRFTPEAAKLIKLIPTDVGRPLSDLATDLRYPELHDDAREVLRTLVFVERSVPSRNEKWFRVRIMPYRTLDNRIDGLVITFTNIRKVPHEPAKTRAR